MADLGGRVVAVLESRRTSELIGLIERHHGVAYPAPALRELHRPRAPELAAAVDLIVSRQVDAVVFLTGVGAGTLLEAAALLGQGDALQTTLASMRIAVRGPKPAAVLRRAGIAFELQAAPPHTTRELVQALDAWPLRGSGVLVQLHGGPSEELHAYLEQRGARVHEVSPYAWRLPTDTTPVLRLIDDLAEQRVDVLAATSASQVANLFAVAEQHGRRERLVGALRRLPLAAQGPVCAAAFAAVDLPVAIVPDHGHMGALVLAIARHFEPAAQEVNPS